MKIIIAHPAAADETGVDLDVTANVDDATAIRLLRDGFARVPEGLPSTVADLKTYAEAEGIPLDGAKTKAEIVAAIEARSPAAPDSANHEGA